MSTVRQSPDKISKKNKKRQAALNNSMKTIKPKIRNKDFLYNLRHQINMKSFVCLSFHEMEHKVFRDL